MTRRLVLATLLLVACSDPLPPLPGPRPVVTLPPPMPSSDCASRCEQSSQQRALCLALRRPTMCAVAQSTASGCACR